MIIPFLLAVAFAAFVCIENVQAHRAAVKRRRREELRRWSPLVDSEEDLNRALQAFEANALLRESSPLLAIFPNAMVPVTTWVPVAIVNSSEPTGFEIDQSRVTEAQWDAMIELTAKRSNSTFEAVRDAVMEGYPLVCTASNFHTEVKA